MATVELKFSPVPEHVRTARMIAAAVGRRCGVPEFLVDEVKLAVGEACARAVGLHRRTAPQELVVVTLDDDVDRFTVRVADRGPAGADVPPPGTGPPRLPADLIDASAQPGPLTDRDEDAFPALSGGLGLAILEGLVDSIVIRPRADGDGSIVSMSWALPGAEKEDTE